jgi:site-specific DNA-cytosine methylase
VGFSEIDKYAVQIYQRYFPDHKNYGDIKLIDETTLPDFDLLVGGFPCQSFSIAGKRGGFNDTRGTLFFEIARILAHKRPRLVLLENVKGLLSHDGGKTFARILEVLTDIGYELQWQILNSKNFGVPQNRERVFVVGNLGGSRRPKVFPIRDNDLECVGSSGEGCANTLTGRSAGGMNWRGNYIKNIKIRRLTPTECARLQGFPDRWHEGVSDSQAYKVYGNAVSVPVVKAIIERMI